MQGKRIRAPRGRVSPATMLLAGSLLVAGLAGCTPKVDQRGNLPDPDDVLAIQPGIDDKAKVFQLLGSPSTAGTFDDKIWYYISKKTEQTAFLDPDVVDQEVLEVKFDDGGIVKDMKLYGLEDGKQIDPVSRVTPTGGQELTFMKQLLGNIGRFNSNESGGGQVGQPGRGPLPGP
jgi:outer membrane protein assembly factor BamE (lipoprotein component of BamABCDE complex)